MLRDELVSRVRFKLGNRTDLDQRIIEELQDVQKLYERALRLPAMLSAVSDITVSSYLGSDLPTRFLRLVPLSPVQAIVNGFIVGFPSRVPYSVHTEAIADYGIVYDLVNTKLHGYPFDPPVTFRLFYYAGEPELISNIENKWLDAFGSLFSMEVAYRLLPYIDEPAIKKSLETNLGQERQAYADVLWREQYSDLRLTFTSGGHL